jgi:hypothetical protein
MVADKFKKNKGNQYAKHGEEFVEEVLRKNVRHPAQNNPRDEAER